MITPSAASLRNEMARQDGWLPLLGNDDMDMDAFARPFACVVSCSVVV